MSAERLQAELARLYWPPGAPALVAPDGGVRALVLELARPADWRELARVWQGVQVDLEWPAPAIAVNGVDGYQLWFSLADPVPAAEAHSTLELLRRRYLGHLPAARVGTWPAAEPALPPPALPPQPGAAGHWSAFVAPDLAALFADDPWLDLEPGADAQSELLGPLASVRAADWRRAQATPAAQVRAAAPAPASEPRDFLLSVMRDEAVALPLRIEAAKALLHAPGS